MWGNWLLGIGSWLCVVCGDVEVVLWGRWCEDVY